MNNITLENFISFCDEMEIAEEGLSNIGKTIQKGFQSLLEVIRRLLDKITVMSRSHNGKITVGSLAFQNYENSMKELDKFQNIYSYFQNNYKSSLIEPYQNNTKIEELKDFLDEFDKRFKPMEHNTYTGHDKNSNFTEIQSSIIIKKLKEYSKEINTARKTISIGSDEYKHTMSDNDIALLIRYYRTCYSTVFELVKWAR